MRKVAGVVSILLLGLAVLLPAGASAAKKKPLPSLYTYKAMIHVAGGITQTSHHDTFRNCQPGQRWTLEEKSEINVRGNILIETYKNRQLRATTAVQAGGGESNHQLIGYEESNYCLPEEPVELDRPECDSLTGKGVVGLTSYSRGGKASGVSVGFGRRTGGAQDLSCMWGLGGRPTPAIAHITTFAGPWSDISLPLQLGVGQFRSLGVKKRLIRTIRVGNTCENPVVYRGKAIPSDTSDMDDGDCVIEGVFNITIKRLNRITKKGVPVG